MESLSFVERVRVVADAIREAKKTVLFLGAGASASAGVPTFRGTNAAESLLEVREDHLVFPNFTHQACKKLLSSGVVAGAVSSNHDALLGPQKHENVVEIFGSVLTEACLKCNARMRRRFAPPPLNRKCEHCGGKLKKTGCRYGQAIYKPGLDAATSLAENAGVALVLGSGMHTWPLSCDGFPARAKMVVLVTLGETAADGNDSITRFDCTCDSFMEVLMKELQLEVEPFVFEEEFVCKWRRSENGSIDVMVDSAEAPVEALCFTHAGTVNGKELDRSNMSYVLTATVAQCNRLEFQLDLRSEFGNNHEKVQVVIQDLQGESGQQKQTFKMKI